MFFVLASCSTYEKLSLQPDFSVGTSNYEDINGTHELQHLVILKDAWASGGMPIITIQRQPEEIYSVHLIYQGGFWKFYDTIKIKADEYLMTLKDSDPYHQVLHGSGKIHEHIAARLTEDTISKLKSCSTLRIQAQNTIKDIPAEGIEAIKTFLSGATTQ